MQLQFKPITIADRDMVERYRKAWDLRSSEYVFTNLFMWGAGEKIEIAEYNDTLYVLHKYEGAYGLFAPLTADRNADYAAAVAVGREYMENSGMEVRFVALSGALIDAFRQSCPEYELKEDRSMFDYVYGAEELCFLKGKKLHAKRNHINQFQSNYKYSYISITSDMLAECMEVYCNWMDHKDTDPVAVQEKLAIECVISNMEALGIVGGGIRIEDKLVAFTLGERIREDMALIYIEKADSDVIGLYSMINQQFVEHEWQDVKFINREEDMGLEGLRRAKLSYQPVELVEKFDAVLRK